MTVLDLSATAERLIMNGYDPVPVVGKAAIAPGWRSPGPITRKLFAALQANCPNATGVGIRTGRAVGLDIDIEDATRAGEVESLAELYLGPTPLRRVGRKGCVLVYKNETPCSKITISAGDKRLVEILGDGQQSVAFGPHPNGGHYRWTGSGDPLSVPLADLPEVTPRLLDSFVAAARQCLIEAGYPLAEVRTRSNPTPTAPNGRPSSPQICEAIIRCIPPDDRENWLKVSAGIAHAPVPDWSTEDRFELFNRWARGDFHGYEPSGYEGEDDCAELFAADAGMFGHE